MTDDDTKSNDEQQPPEPEPDVKRLNRLVGTWDVSGGAQGTIRYEWMEGGFFLIQHVDLERDGRTHKGMEIIGHEQPLEGGPSEDIKSRYYGSKGSTLDYVYELEGDTLRIWFGERGSSNHFEGEFSDDGETLTGAWEWPEEDGSKGGYEAVMTRVE